MGFISVQILIKLYLNQKMAFWAHCATVLRGLVGYFGKLLMNFLLVDKSVIDPMATFWPVSEFFLGLL